MALAAVAVTAGVAAVAEAQPFSGGLVPAPRKTRDELIREWDLNSDGKIDEGEALVAASKMRRERAALRLNSGIDPRTGLPRGEQAALDEDAAAAEANAAPPRPADELPAEPPPSAKAGPRDGRPGAGQTGRAAGPAAGSRAAADAKRQAVMGGVRAGGLPARAGYGSGVPAAPLNAGLPITPQTRPLTAPSPAAQSRGGLVPGPRAPTPAAAPVRSRELYDPY